MALLEREPSLAALADYADQARHGEGRLVLIAGEAGVGKSALLDQFAAHLASARWCWGACDGLFTPRPLGAFLDIAGQLWTRALGELLPRSRATVSFTVFGFRPLRERIRDTVLPALEPLPETVTVAEDPGRQRARGYYERGAIRIDVGPAGQPQEVGDGGFTDWTAQLLSDAKERCFISCISTERLAATVP